MRKYFLSIGIAFSILLNAILGGSPYQTFCARNYDAKRMKRLNIVWLLDLFLGKDHCLMDWVTWRLRIESISRSNR
jgi:hypothetical protein